MPTLFLLEGGSHGDLRGQVLPFCISKGPRPTPAEVRSHIPPLSRDVDSALFP